jgi:hypothetical protein
MNKLLLKQLKTENLPDLYVFEGVFVGNANFELDNDLDHGLSLQLAFLNDFWDFKPLYRCSSGDHFEKILLSGHEYATLSNKRSVYASKHFSKASEHGWNKFNIGFGGFLNESVCCSVYDASKMDLVTEPYEYQFIKKPINALKSILLFKPANSQDSEHIDRVINNSYQLTQNNQIECVINELFSNFLRKSQQKVYNVEKERIFGGQL